MSEAAILARVRIALSKAGAIISRNNCGAYHDAKGRFIRYGVFSPGGADLIGWRSVLVTPEMVGQRVAVFVACEVKADTIPTREQRHFLETVALAGGIAILAHSEEEATDALCKRPDK